MKKKALEKKRIYLKSLGQLEMQVGPPPMAGNTYDVLSEIICNVAMKVAKASMIHAASELKQSERSDVGVSIDGSCQRRGFSSLNGVITAISINSGNSLDCQILSRHCKACVIHAPK